MFQQSGKQTIQLRSLCRLPVFFLLDVSSETIGTLAVTMQQGLTIVGDQVCRDARTVGCSYLSCTLFGERIQHYPLCSPWLFQAPQWQPGGHCLLGPALQSLSAALQTELLISYPYEQRDYPPLIFLLLGSQPLDDWQAAFLELTSRAHTLAPLLVTLITRQELHEVIRPLGGIQLQLRQPSGEMMTDFFYWAVRTIGQLYSQYYQGRLPLTFPSLPASLLRLR